MTRKILIAFAAAAVIIGGWIAYGRFYAAPASQLSERLASLAVETQRLEGALAEYPRIRSELRRLGGEAVGGAFDAADHAIRSGLMELVGRSGLRQVSVDTGAPGAPANPYTRARRVRSSGLQRALRTQRDYFVVDAKIRGVGTLEESLATVALLQAQPWIGRVKEWAIDVRGDERRQFQFNCTVEVLYLPDLGSRTIPDLVGGDDLLIDQWSAIAAKNVFRHEPPRVVVQAEPPPPIRNDPPPPPPPPPYHEWRVTGITEELDALGGVHGVLVTVTRSGARASNTLSVGQKILGATLVSGGVSSAVFEIEGQQYVVALGETLAQRRQIP
ncbi:MAG: hypothetical protein KF866_03025 [Phycisphaeraceae bacterium]|nr:hypothetical protein [Phycisphaeraceae bacterium]MCW5753331.1 hypothetical protein [Phycisphaeraceae bacterium]